MKNRIAYDKIAPNGLKNMLNMEGYFNKEVTLDPLLVELVKVRVSQINGCAYCIDTHTKAARKLGETEQRLYLLNAWHETTFYSQEESVALKLAEKLTLIADNLITENYYNEVRETFDEKELVDLVFLINQVNSWNRLSLAMGNQVN